MTRHPLHRFDCTATSTVNKLSKYVTSWDGDNSQALANAIAACQRSSDGWASRAARHVGGESLELDVPEGQALKLASKVEIDDDASVKLFAGPRGALVEYTGAGDYALYIPSGNRQVQLENLVFWKGGIEVEGGVKGLRIRDCHFEATTDVALKMLGQSVVDARVVDCLFHACAGGVSVDYANCDLFIIDRCKFWRNTNTDAVLSSSGLFLRDCDFEIRPTANSDKPYIHINGGGPMVRACRFGNEVEAGGAPPARAVVVGPLSGGTTGTLTDIEICDCKFFGTLGTASADSACYAITFNKAPNVSRVSGNRFNAYYGNGTDNTPCCDTAYTDVLNRVNYWSDNRAYGWGGAGGPTSGEWGLDDGDWSIR
jgi:hypothetical protein